MDKIQRTERRNGIAFLTDSLSKEIDLLTAQKNALLKEDAELLEEERLESVPPVDHSARVLTDGSPVTDDHRELKANGQQKGYVVLSAEERSKGFVRPVRRTYLHKVCHTTTSMSHEIAETYARCPSFYSGTFCAACRAHFALDQFVWEGTNQMVGS